MTAKESSYENIWENLFNDLSKYWAEKYLMSQTAPKEEDKRRFKLLDAIYALSKGYKFSPVSTGRLYDELHATTDEEKQVVKQSYQYLRNAGLAKSTSLGNVSITHKGIKEYENSILEHSEHTANFSPHISQTLSEECRESRKREIETIQNQRRLFYKEAKESPKGPLNQVYASPIIEKLGYDKETFERIYFYFVDEGVINGFTLGGDFILAGKSFEDSRLTEGGKSSESEGDDPTLETKSDEKLNGIPTQSPENSEEITDKSNENTQLNKVPGSAGLSKYVNTLLDSQFPQHDLMNVDHFLKYLKNLGVKLTKEDLEFYDRHGIIRPVLRFKQQIEKGEFFRDPFSLKSPETKTSREQIELPSDDDFQPWKNYGQTEKEWVILYYHPFQLILAHWLTKNNRKSLSPQFIEDVKEISKERLDSWKEETAKNLATSANAAVETWIPIVGLLMLLDEGYSVWVTGRFSGDSNSRDQSMLWRQKEIASQILTRSGLTIEQVKQAYERIVTLAHIHNPLAHWYPLLELIKSKKKKRLTGDARLAQEYYELARMIKLFIEDLTGEIMLDPDDMFDSNHANWKPTAYGSDPLDYDDPKTQQLILDDYFIDRPFLIAIVFEGDTEELVIEEILRLFMRDPNKEDYFLYNAQGSGNMETRNLDAMIELAKSNQMEIYLIMDNDGKADSTIAQHKKLGNIKEDMFTKWNKDFEYDNFGSNSVVDTVNQELKSKGLNPIPLKEVEDKMNNMKKGVLMKALSDIIWKYNEGTKLEDVISKKELARRLIAPRIEEIQKEFYTNGKWERKLPIEKIIDKLFQKFPSRF